MPLEQDRYGRNAPRCTADGMDEGMARRAKAIVCATNTVFATQVYSVLRLPINRGERPVGSRRKGAVGPEWRTEMTETGWFRAPWGFIVVAVLAAALAVIGQTPAAGADRGRLQRRQARRPGHRRAFRGRRDHL